MAYKKESYVEHIAVCVKDIEWHIRFFQEALGMPVYSVTEPEDDPKQVWIIGGIQLISDPNFEGPEGRMSHLGIMTEDLESALKEVYKWGVTEMSQGRNWVSLPDGICIELIQANKGSVSDILAINCKN